jgi:hypothetical protein
LARRATSSAFFPPTGAPAALSAARSSDTVIASNERAGLAAAATTLVAVNGRAFSGDVLKDAVVQAKDGGPLDLLVRTGDRYRTVSVEWRGGLYYPHLEAIAEGSDRLNDVLQARAP